VREFGGRCTEEKIGFAANAALAALQEAPVRSYVVTIANRRAREVLRGSHEPAVAR